MSLSLKQQAIAFQTILTKEIARFMRIWSQTILPPVITMTLYFIIFGKLIGSQIGHVQGYSYMQYIVPGLTMMAIVTNSYSNTTSSFFLAKFTKSVEDMLVSPMPNYIIMLGFMLGGTLRGLMVGISVILVSLFFTHLHIAHLGMVIVMALLSSMVFSLGGIINGIFAKNFDDIAFIPTFVITPLTYLGGVFYSIDQLHGFWRTLSIFNPIMEIVDTFKFGILGVSEVNIYFGFSLVFILFIVLIIWCLRLMDKGIGLRS